MAVDYYKALGVDEKADKEAIKKKYRQLAKKYHPDRNKGDKASEERFKEISAAYDVLGDDKKRQQYDNMRRFGGGPGMAGGFPGGGRGQFYTEGDFSNMFGNGFSYDDLSGMGGLGDIFSSVFGGNMRTRRPRGRPRRPTGPQKGRDLRAEIKITFLQAARGVTKKIRVSVPDSCPTCNGAGATTGGEP
ncbi:MAG: DnaJ domain-containing protein, partial [FCB group bacterium]|nr:DnaJ domain-containing protein [FCB group bacterium]